MVAHGPRHDVISGRSQSGNQSGAWPIDVLQTSSLLTAGGRPQKPAHMVAFIIGRRCAVAIGRIHAGGRSAIPPIAVVQMSPLLTAGGLPQEPAFAFRIGRRCRMRARNVIWSSPIA